MKIMTQIVLLISGLVTLGVLLHGCGDPPAPDAHTGATYKQDTRTMHDSQPDSKPSVTQSDQAWQEQLSEQQYRVLRCSGTEPAFSGKYWNTKTPGVYRCAGCGQVLYESDAKFDSGSGWPSFTRAYKDGAVTYHPDTSHGMTRTEVRCSRCGGHLGHVFDDGPGPTGKRHCINSVSLQLDPAE